jgi:DNA polymerase I-like protein with 3'-5' exonuclease and polymerase domains
MAQDKVAMAEIMSGVDQHGANAVSFFGDIKFRQAAKIMTFRLLYGGSAYAFFMDPQMPSFTLKNWNEIVSAYERKYIGIAYWQQQNILSVGSNYGVLVSPTGRRYTIPMSPHKKHPGVMVYTETCIKNYPVQGTATGDIVPLAMNEMDDRMTAQPEKFISSNWMGTVHDSLIFDTMPHEVKRVAMTGIQVFEDLPEIISNLWGVDFNLPLTGEATWGPTYGAQTTSVQHKEGQWILKKK